MQQTTAAMIGSLMSGEAGLDRGIVAPQKNNLCFLGRMPLRQTKLWGSLASHVDSLLLLTSGSFKVDCFRWKRLQPGQRKRKKLKTPWHPFSRFRRARHGKVSQRFPREDMFFGCFAMLRKLGQRIHLIWIYQGMLAVSTATGPEASGKEDEGSSRSSAEGLFPDLAETKGEGSENLAFSCEWKIYMARSQIYIRNILYRYRCTGLYYYNLIYSCCRRFVQCDCLGLLVRLLTHLGCCWELTVIGPLWAVAVGPFWAVQSLCFKLLLLMDPTASMICETASVVSPIGYWWLGKEFLSYVLMITKQYSKMVYTHIHHLMKNYWYLHCPYIPMQDLMSGLMSGNSWCCPCSYQMSRWSSKF